MARRVLIATPTTLLAMLRAVAYGWQQERVAESAQAISELGRELHGRLVKLSTLLATLGTRLNSTVRAYNDAVGSYEARVLPAARRFEDHGSVAAGRELPELEPVTVSARSVHAAELDAGAGDRPTAGARARAADDAPAARGRLAGVTLRLGGFALGLAPRSLGLALGLVRRTPRPALAGRRPRLRLPPPAPTRARPSPTAPPTSAAGPRAGAAADRQTACAGGRSRAHRRCRIPVRIATTPAATAADRCHPARQWRYVRAPSSSQRADVLVPRLRARGQGGRRSRSAAAGAPRSRRPLSASRRRRDLAGPVLLVLGQIQHALYPHVRRASSTSS